MLPLSLRAFLDQNVQPGDSKPNSFVRASLSKLSSRGREAWGFPIAQEGAAAADGSLPTCRVRKTLWLVLRRKKCVPPPTLLPSS